MAITINAAATMLKEHVREYDEDIKQTLRNGMETEMYGTLVETDHTYVAPNATIGDVIQPFQCAFTPNLVVDMNEVSNTLQDLKIDIQVTCAELEAFVSSWKNKWVQKGISLKDYTFPHFIYDEIVFPKVVEEMETIAWKGVRAAPTPGTAGALLTSVDGFLKKIADAITGSLLTPIATGAIVSTTIVSQVETMLDGMDLAYRNLPLTVLMSPTNARLYQRNYRSDYGSEMKFDKDDDLIKIDYTNKTIKALPGLEGSNRIIVTPTRNLLIGKKTGESALPEIRWQEFERTLKGLAEFHRFYGVGFWGAVFVNDQA